MPNCGRIRYHEKQRQGRCGQHAINNLLQARRSTCNNLNKIAEKLSEEFGIDKEDLTNDNGYYDVSVIVKFLVDRGYEVHQLQESEFYKMSRRQSNRLLGYILGDGRHWKSIRKTNNIDCYYVIDSMDTEKEHIKVLGEYMYENNFEIAIKVLKPTV